MELKVGDIFTSEADWKVVPVNCFGVMGKGLALEFKNRYPEMFQGYRDICRKGCFTPGMLWAWKEDKILCFPTKYHWKDSSKLEWIENGLCKFLSHYQRLGITSIAFPLLGCGLGGLREEEVLSVMENYLERTIGLEYEIWKNPI